MKDIKSKLSLIWYILKSHDQRLFQSITNWSGAVALWMQSTGSPTDVVQGDSILTDTFFMEGFSSKEVE